MPAATVTVCGVVYEIQFDKTGPTLTLTSLTGSGGSLTGTLECCQCNFAIFAFGGPVLCTDERVVPGGCSNIFRLQVELDCCPIAGWDGEGWYCVRDAGTEDVCVAAELLDEDKCDDTIEICSGPYATEGDADAVCPPAVPAACQGLDMSGYVARFSGQTGGCDCMTSDVTGPFVPQDPPNLDTNIWDQTDCTPTTNFTLSCVDGQYVAVVASTRDGFAWSGDGVITSFTASPFELVARFLLPTNSGCGADGGSVTVTITPT